MTHFSSPPPLTSKRDAELDGLRGLAVGLVLAWHFIGIPAWSTEGQLAHAVFRVFLLGGAGVDLFFVLSGFLITRIIIGRTHSGGRFLATFYARRSLRILPPYLLLVGLFWAVVAYGINNPVFNADVPLWRHLTFTQNYWMAQHASYGPDGIAVTWSVAIEEQYYMVFPLLCLLLPRKWLPLALWCIALGSIVFRAWIFSSNPSNNFPSDLGTLARLDGLAAGGLIACAFDDAQARDWLQRHSVKFRRALWIGLLLLPLVNRTSGSNMAYFGHTFLTLLFALLLINILLNLGSDLPWVRALRGCGLRFLGRISYAAYLFHPLIMSLGFMLFKLPKNLGGLPQVAVLCASLSLTLLFCYVLFDRVERHLIGFGHRLNY